jgi:DNA (cytosine-5)-methyltransferase 1
VSLRGLDIFCGAGGSSAGARAAGIDLAAGIDMCPVATETYQANFPGATVLTDRLERVDLSKLKRRIGSIDLLLASPECTNHTCAKGAAPRDEGSRATAMLVVEYARAFRPRWLVLENVVHMRPWSRYGELKRELESLGYKLREQVLDASDFGVAQSRRRLFLVGDRKQEPNVKPPTRRGRRRTVKSILDPAGTWSTSRLFSDGRAQGTLERAERAFDVLGKESRFLLVYYGSDGSGGWQPLDRPLRTITTVDRFALVEPDNGSPTMRMLQVPELKRAMGFSDSYELPTGSRRDRIRLLGNGVCPPVMEAVVSRLISGTT